MRFMLFQLLTFTSAALLLVVLFELANRVSRARLETAALSRGVDPGLRPREAAERPHRAPGPDALVSPQAASPSACEAARRAYEEAPTLY